LTAEQGVKCYRAGFWQALLTDCGVGGWGWQTISYVTLDIDWGRQINIHRALTPGSKETIDRVSRCTKLCGRNEAANRI